MRFIKYNPNIKNEQIFGLRLINKVKGKVTNKLYKKTRLVIQGYSDDGKAIILCQSPTIQRASQQIIVVLAPSLRKLSILI